VAAAAGLAAGLCVILFSYQDHPLTVSDFDVIWIGARALRAHQDPYAAIQPPPCVSLPWRRSSPDA
jgi:hypothetical protein